MTSTDAPAARTAPSPGSLVGLPHLGIDGAVLGDALLARAGVRLPWSRLGGDPVHHPTRPDGRVEVAGAAAVAAVAAVGSVADGATLVLTDPTSLPVAALEEVLVEDDAVVGVLRALGGADDEPWLTGSPAPLVVRRPPLAGEVGRLAAATPPRVVVPTGPSPDGLPGAVLLEAWRAALDGHGAAPVPAPLVWRDEAADAALMTSYGDALGATPAVLAADDADWVAVRGAALDGTPEGLDPAAAEVLRRWRPPAASRGVVVLFTGLSGSGKSSLADALVEHVRTRSGRTVTLLDGDVVRTMLSTGLGFDRAGRDLNVRRIGYVAAEIARHHGMAVCAPIAPFAATRAAVRAMVEEVGGDLVLVHVATPLAECERRDRKGLYARARAGEIPDFTGISSPYEVPTDAELTVDTTGQSLEESLDVVVRFLVENGWIAR